MVIGSAVVPWLGSWLCVYLLLDYWSMNVGEYAGVWMLEVRRDQKGG